MAKKAPIRTGSEPEPAPPRKSKRPVSKRARHRPPQYDQAVVQALVTLWEASDRMCGKGLKDLIPVLLPVLVRNGHLRPDTGIQAKLLAVSAATIDRLLRDARAAQLLSHGARCPTVLRRSVRKQTRKEWPTPPRPGYMEAQVISHRGERATGRAALTLRLTDLYSGWTERAPVGVDERNAVIPHLHALVARLPFKPRGLALGGGFAFLLAGLLLRKGRRLDTPAS